MVLFQHFQYLLPDADRWPFQRWGLGIIAVDLFFVISGFIIAEAISTYYVGRPWNFLGNRLLRIVPPYIVALTVSIILHQLLWSNGTLQVWDYPVTDDPVSLKSIGINLLLLFPGVPKSIADKFQFIPFVWSLRAELLFYAIAFIATWTAARSPRWNRQVFGSFVLAGFALLGLFFLRGNPPLLGNAVFFLVGIFLFQWSRSSGPAAFAYLGAAAVTAALAIPAFYRLIPPKFPWVREEQIVIMFALGLVLAILIKLRPTVWMTQKFKKIDRICGDLSYPLYLNHYVVGIALFNLVTYRGFELYAAGIVSSLLVAMLMNWVVEIPLRSIRSRIRGATV
jgi:peptidoglycan/LPS O-acetylase OafA/YrhL